MSSALKVIPFDVPEKFVSNSCGFALDIGGSVAKLVYRSKQEYKDGKPLKSFGAYGDGQPKGRLNLMLVPRNKLEVVIDYIQKHCDLTSRDGNITINTTGIGGNFFKQRLQKELGIKTKNVFETDCFVKAANLMREVSADVELYLPLPEEAIKQGELLALSLSRHKEALEARKDTASASASVPDVQPYKEWPVGYAMCGSGFALLQVDASGKHRMVEGLFKGGRSFLGITRMLTGLEDYSEMMALAEKGNGHSVDIMASEMKAPDDGHADDEAVLSKLALLPFGKVTDQPKDKLHPYDLVHSLLNIICTDLARVVYLGARRFQINRVFFVGNFVNNQMVRHMLTSELTIHNACRKPWERPLEFQFMRNGGFFGSLGAYLYDSLNQKSQTP